MSDMDSRQYAYMDSAPGCLVSSEWTLQWSEYQEIMTELHDKYCVNDELRLR